VGWAKPGPRTGTGQSKDRRRGWCGPQAAGRGHGPRRRRRAPRGACLLTFRGRSVGGQPTGSCQGGGERAQPVDPLPCPSRSCETRAPRGSQIKLPSRPRSDRSIAEVLDAARQEARQRGLLRVPCFILSTDVGRHLHRAPPPWPHGPRPPFGLTKAPSALDRPSALRQLVSRGRAASEVPKDHSPPPCPPIDRISSPVSINGTSEAMNPPKPAIAALASRLLGYCRKASCRS